MKYRWLHLSDLHSYCDQIKTKIMRESLIDEVEELNKEDSFDFIIITGDLSDKNVGYDIAEDLILEIIDKTGVSKNNVFIVPGNHDLDRNVPKDRKDIVEELWQNNILDKDIEEDKIKKLIGGQVRFFETYRNILDREYPKDKIHFVEKIDDGANLIHLNTAWMCYDSNKEDGKLHIGLNSVFRCFDGVEKEDFNIVIGHHRLEDLNSEVRNNLKTLFKSKGVDMYLGGHCHEAIVKHDRRINIELCFCKQARAEYDEYPAGFIVGNIDSDNNQSYFLFFNWITEYSKWIYDYSVDVAKHGKYYIEGERFNKNKSMKRDTIIDFKIMGLPLDYANIKTKYNLENTADYKYGHKNIRPNTDEEWKNYLRDLINFYNSIIANIDSDNIHIFPIAPIPLLVALGYLMQNNNPNIKIYQYNENEQEWVFDEKEDNIKLDCNYVENDSKHLAVAISVSGYVKEDDIKVVMSQKYDLLSVKVDTPKLSYLSYRADVLNIKKIVKDRLDSIYSKYNDIHLFIAAPAGVCIEVGRIIRENMYPNTYIYNYSIDDDIHYRKIYNLKKIFTT